MRALLAGIVLIVVLIAAGCGGASSTTTTNGSGKSEASKSATQVLSDALKATHSASSFHMSGTEPSSSGSIVLDLSVVKGKGAQGSVTFGADTIQLSVVGSNGYVKASPSGWKQLAGSSGAMIARRLAGRWLKFPVRDPEFQPILAYSDPKVLFDELQSSDSAPVNLGTKTYKGQSVVEVHDVVHNGKLYVAATGPPYPVALLGSAGGTITFSDWNKPVSLTAPTNVLDFSQLNG